MNIMEAFRALDALNEDVFDLDSDGIKELSNFTQNDDLEDNIEIIDPEAENEDELQDNYIGKVILDCCVCHSKLYKDKSEVTISDDGDLANVGEECPYCFTPDGFKVIGEVAAFGGDGDEDELEELLDVNVASGNSSSSNVSQNMPMTLDISANGNDVAVGGAAGGLSESVNTGGSTINEGIFDKFKKKKRSAPDDNYELGWVASPNGTRREGFVVVDVYKGGRKVDYDKTFQAVYMDKEDAEWNASRSTRKSKGKFTAKAMPIAAAEDYVGKKFPGVDPNAPVNIPESMNESYMEVDTITCGDEQYRVIGGGFNTRDALISVEDENGTKRRLSSSDVFEFYTFLDRKGNVIREPEDIDESLTESVRSVGVETDDSVVTVSADEGGKVTVSTEPVTADGGETIEPISAETESELMGEDEPTEDGEEVDVELDEFDEESMNELGESYFRKVYENIDGFKTTGVKTTGNSMIVEGKIRFNNGLVKNTSFMFEATNMTSSGRVSFVGDNRQLTEGKKAFTLTGRVRGKKFIAESMSYNYNQNNREGKLSRVRGIERVSRRK